MSGFTGSLQMDIALPGVAGVPGSPVDFTFHYSSGTDDAGTWGTKLVVDWYHEYREYNPTYLNWASWRPDSVEAAGVAFSDQNGTFAPDPPGLYFNADFDPADPDDEDVCLPFRSPSLGPVVFSPDTNPSAEDHEETPLELIVPAFTISADRCLTRADDHGSNRWVRRSLAIPLRMGVASQYRSRQVAAGASCPAPEFLSFPDAAGVYNVRPGLQMKQDTGERRRMGFNDPAHPCTAAGQPLFLQKFDDPDVARMGRNWSHGFAQHLTLHGDTDARRFVVLHAPGGGATLYGEPARTLGVPVELTPIPRPPIDAPSCDCHGARLFRTSRGYEILQRDGSRRVFAGAGSPVAPAGRLLRVEGLHGRNAIVLEYDTLHAELAAVRDAAGNTYSLTYSDLPVGRRLTRIDLPGGRFATFSYDAAHGRLETYRDPGLSAGGAAASGAFCTSEPPQLDADSAWHFCYGTRTDGKDRFDIVRKHDPDGEVVEYEYFADGNIVDTIFDGHIARATRNRGSLTESTITYAYGVGNDATDRLTAWSFPPLSESAPNVQQDFHADGRLIKQTTYSADGAGTHSIRHDADGRPLVVETVYDALDQDWDGDGTRDGRKLCIAYDVFGNVKGVTGPICREAGGGDVLWRWGQADCEKPETSQSCPSDTVVWEALAAPAMPSDLGATARYFRVASVDMASNPGQRLRLLYYDEDTDPMTLFDGELRFVCPPHYGGAPDAPATECQAFTYEVRPVLDPATHATDFDILLLQATSVGSGDQREQSTFDYDLASHLLAKATDGEGYETSLAYDPFTRLVSNVNAPGGLKTSYQWTPRGQLEYVTSAKDQPGPPATTAFAYSPGGKLRRVTDLKRRVSWWLRYDAAGHQDKVSRGRGQHVTGETLATNTASPDESAARVSVQRDFDPNDQVTRTIVLGANGGDPPACPQPGGLIETIHYRYDGFGNLRERDIGSTMGTVDECFEVDPRTERVTEVRFGLPWPGGPGNQTGCTGTGEAVESFVYDALGQLRRSQFAWLRADGAPGGHHSTCYALDEFSRLLDVRSEASPTAFGQPYLPTCAAPPAFTQSIAYGYDASERPTAMDVSYDGVLAASLAYTYDRASRVSRQEDALASKLTTYAYRDNGQVESVLREGPGGPLPLPPVARRQYTMGYDAAGRLTTVDDWDLQDLTPAAQNHYLFGHDDVWRLTAASASRGPMFVGAPANLYDLGYTFSAIDDWNIESIVDNKTHSTVSFTYDDFDELETVNSADVGFHYDHRGNLRCDDQRTMEWDPLNRMTSVLHAGKLTQYAYDPFNRLVAHRTDDDPVDDAGDTTDNVVLHLWDGWQQLGEYVEGGAEESLLYAAGPVGVQGHRRPGETLTRYGRNIQGSTTDSVRDEPAYKPYGEVALGPLPATLGFQGHEFRSEAGLHYMRNRWYDQRLGRFMSVDPIIGSSVTNYAFAAANPVMNEDPLGLAVLLNDTYGGVLTFIPYPECPRCPVVAIPVSTDVVSSAAPGSQDSFVTDDVAQRWIPRDRRYGIPGAYIDVGNQYDIHGGGSRLPDPYDLDQSLVPTEGCSRGSNRDVRAMAGIIMRFKKMYNAKVPYIRFGTPVGATKQQKVIPDDHPFIRALRSEKLQITRLP